MDSPMPKIRRVQETMTPLPQGGQIGLCLPLKHVRALAGRAGQHEHMPALRLEGAAGGGAVGVGEHGAALGQLGLLEVVFGHLLPPFGEPVPQSLGQILVED